MLTDQVKITDKYGKTRYTRPPDRSTLKTWLDDKIDQSGDNFLQLYKDCINLKKDKDGNVDKTWKTNMEKNYKELEDKKKELTDIRKAITDFSENQKKLEEKTKELEAKKKKVDDHPSKIEKAKEHFQKLKSELGKKSLDQFKNIEELRQEYQTEIENKKKLDEELTNLKNAEPVNDEAVDKKKKEVDKCAIQIAVYKDDITKEERDFKELKKTYGDEGINLLNAENKIKELENETGKLDQELKSTQDEVKKITDQKLEDLEKKQKDLSKELLDLQVKHGKELQGHVKTVIEGDITLYSKNMTESEIKKEQKLQRMRLQKLNWLFGKEEKDEGRLQKLHTKKEQFDEKVKKWEELNVLDADSEEAKKALKDLEDYTRKEIRTEPINLHNAIMDLSVKNKWDIIGNDVFGMAGNKLFSFDEKKGSLTIDRNTEEGREAALEVLLALKKSNTPYIKVKQGDEIGIELALAAGFTKDKIIEIRNPQDYKRERAERMLSQDFYGIDDIWKERTLTERERQGESISTSGGGETLQQRRERELREGSQNQPKNINLKQN